MNIIKGFFLIFLIIGILLIALYFMRGSDSGSSGGGNTKIVYKYLPRSLEEEEESPVYVSEIFKAMFEQPSVWINSIKDDYLRKNEVLNKYYISQI
jgi:hypothetical protein